VNSEFFEREARKALESAHQAEVAGQIELADACGAVAANKLAAAIRTSQVVECPNCFGGVKENGATCIRCSGRGMLGSNGGEP
jgi:hypothetical protein